MEILMGRDLVLYAGLALIGFAAFWALKQFMAHQEAAASDALLNVEVKKAPPSKSLLIQIAKPIFDLYVVPSVRRMKIDDWRKKSKQKLIAAGVIDKLDPDQFLALKLSAIFVTPVAYYFYMVLLEGTSDISYGLLSGVLGFYLPDIWVNSARTKRVAAIRAQLPFAVDMMALIAEAGTDLNGAMRKVIERSKPSPLIDEFRQVNASVALGTPRADALREMAERVDLTELGSLVSIINTAEAMGASVSGVLRQQAEQFRLERMIRAEKAAATIPTKLQLVTLLAVGSVMMVMIGPFVIDFLGSGAS